MKLTDKQFMAYVNRGARGGKLCVGAKVTTEKVLEVSDNSAEDFIFVSNGMEVNARAKKVLTISVIDDSDDTCYLSDGYWYDIDLLTVI